MKPIKAWHFVTADRRLGYDDGRQVRAGRVYAMRPAVDDYGVAYDYPHLCRAGMHGSTDLLDALRYAPGPIVCRVEIWGDVALGDDKLCGRFRRVLWTVNADTILHEFACWCAERALRRAKVTDKRCWGAIEAKRAWLRGEIGDSELDAAWAAAWAAARDAARDAARAAERKAQGRKLVRMLRDARRTA